MLKLGVTTRDGLLRARTLFGRRRNVSLLLLRELASDPMARPEEYDRLTGYVRMPNGVWKRTRHGRMRLVDSAVVDLLLQSWPTDTRLTVCDLAASSGATSVELYKTLGEVFPLDFVATDLYRDILAVRSRHWPVAVVLDGRGTEIQYILGPFVLPCSPPESRAFPVNWALHSMIKAYFAPEARNVLGRIDVAGLPPFAEVDVASYKIVRLPVLTRETLDAMAAGDFRFETWDILKPLPMGAHIVRAMNIFTRDHFSDDDRARGLRNCVSAVHPGGLFVVGWSPTSKPETIEASIYGVRDERLIALRRFNGGSEIDSLIASIFPVVEDASSFEGTSLRTGSRG